MSRVIIFIFLLVGIGCSKPEPKLTWVTDAPSSRDVQTGKKHPQYNIDGINFCFNIGDTENNEDVPVRICAISENESSTEIELESIEITTQRKSKPKSVATTSFSKQFVKNELLSVSLKQNVKSCEVAVKFDSEPELDKKLLLSFIIKIDDEFYVLNVNYSAIPQKNPNGLKLI